MRRPLAALLGAVIAGAALCAVALDRSRLHDEALPPSSPGLAVGVPAPALALQDVSGQPWSIETLRGAPAVLLLIRGVG